MHLLFSISVLFKLPEEKEWQRVKLVVLRKTAAIV